MELDYYEVGKYFQGNVLVKLYKKITLSSVYSYCMSNSFIREPTKGRAFGYRLSVFYNPFSQFFCLIRTYSYCGRLATLNNHVLFALFFYFCLCRFKKIMAL